MHKKILLSSADRLFDMYGMAQDVVIQNDKVKSITNLIRSKYENFIRDLEFLKLYDEFRSKYPEYLYVLKRKQFDLVECQSNVIFQKYEIEQYQNLPSMEVEQLQEMKELLQYGKQLPLSTQLLNKYRELAVMIANSIARESEPLDIVSNESIKVKKLENGNWIQIR